MRLPSLLLLALVSAAPGVVRAEDVDSREEYVVNGQPVAEGETHGTVALVVTESPMAAGEIGAVDIFNYLACTATLVAPTVAVTAAHCVDQCLRESGCVGPDGSIEDCQGCEARPPPEDTVFVVAGARTLDDAWRAQAIGVREVVIHEEWGAFDDWDIDPSTGLGTGIHDIAVLILDAAPPVTPIGLFPSDAETEPELGVAQGYGLKQGILSETLLPQEHVESLLNEMTSPIDQITDEEILVGANDDDAGLCFGDSGGPLYARHGGELLLLGVAARATGQEEEEPCGPGGVHTSIPGHHDWILEKAPSVGGVGGRNRGCGVCSGPPYSNAALWLLALLWLARSRARAGLAVIALTTVLAGCGDSGNDQGALCTPERDPLGTFCDAETERIDLLSAEALAREAAPADAWLWGVFAGRENGLNLDGEAEYWLFRYYRPGGETQYVGIQLDLIYVSATGELRQGATENSFLVCAPSRPIAPLDSLAVLRDAIPRIERNGPDVRLEGERELSVTQLHICDGSSGYWNAVSYGEINAYYDEAGEHLGMLDTSEL